MVSQGTRRRILVVDDDHFDVDALTDPELALSIRMPKMDGFELYERLKTVDPGVKVCFLIASEMYREEIREGEYQTLSKDLFLQKPISNDDLIREIHNKIGSA